MSLMDIRIISNTNLKESTQIKISGNNFDIQNQLRIHWKNHLSLRSIVIN